MKTLFVGGALHGQTLDVEDGARTFQSIAASDGNEPRQLYVARTFRDLNAKADTPVMALHPMELGEVARLAYEILHPHG